MPDLVPFTEEFLEALGIEWNPAQVQLLYSLVSQQCPGMTREEFLLFMRQCAKTGLDPFARQIYALRVQGEDRHSFVVQVSIDGLRVIAQRTGQYIGQLGPYWCGPDGQWRDVWLEETPPAAAKVGVLRRGFEQPVWGIALWREFAPYNKAGQLRQMWRKFPAHMLAKVAEAIAFRRAFPQELSGIYTAEEMEQARVREEGEVITVEGGVVANGVTVKEPTGGREEKRAPKEVANHDEGALRSRYLRAMAKLSTEAGWPQSEWASHWGAIAEELGYGGYDWGDISTVPTSVLYEVGKALKQRAKAKDNGEP